MNVLFVLSFLSKIKDFVICFVETDISLKMFRTLLNNCLVANYKSISEISWIKELSLCHKLKFSNPYIFETWCCKSLIFYTVGSNNIHSLNIPKVYDIRLQRSKDFKIRVCGKYSIPFILFLVFTVFIKFPHFPYLVPRPQPSQTHLKCKFQNIFHADKNKEWKFMNLLKNEQIFNFDL